MPTVSYTLPITKPTYLVTTNPFVSGLYYNTPDLATLSNGIQVGGWVSTGIPLAPANLGGLDAASFNVTNRQATGQNLRNELVGQTADVALAALTSGRAVFVYTDKSGGTNNAEVKARVYTAGSSSFTPFTAEIDLSTALGGLDNLDASVIGLADGRFAVTWTRLAGGVISSSVQMGIYNANGTVSVSPFEVSSSVTTSSSQSQITQLSNGNMVVSWTELTATNRVTTRMFDSNGNDLTSNLTVGGSFTSRNSKVTATKDGGYVVAYEDKSWSAGANYDITVKKYSSAGSFEWQAQANTGAATGEQGMPEVNVLNNGFIAVSWRNDASAATSAISLAVFDKTNGARVYNNTNFATAETFAMDVGGAYGEISFLTSQGDMSYTAAAFKRTTNGDNTSETLLGDDINDIMNGFGGSDIFISGYGRDVIDGGAGADAAVYSAARSDYFVNTQSGQAFVQDFRAGIYDTDALINVEALSFNGAVFGLKGEQQNNISNMDGQRYDDVLLQNSTTGQVIYQNMTAGVGGGFVNVLLGMPAGWKVFSSDDIVGDSAGSPRAEVFLHDINTGSIYAYNAGPTATPWTLITTGFTSNFRPIATGDVTLDGISDILVRNDTTGEVFVGDVEFGGTLSGFVAMPNVGTGWRTVGLGDFNADGASDILIQNIADGTTYYRDMVNNAWGVVSTALGSAWVAREAADVNGDGYSDVIFRNTTDGNIWYRNMLGGTGGTWGVVANGLTGWDIRTIADVENDGYRDVIIQNTADGTTYYADMDNGVMTKFGVVSAALGTSWLVV